MFLLFCILTAHGLLTALTNLTARIATRRKGKPHTRTLSVKQLRATSDYHAATAGEPAAVAMLDPTVKLVRENEFARHRGRRPRDRRRQVRHVAVPPHQPRRGSRGRARVVREPQGQTRDVLPRGPLRPDKPRKRSHHGRCSQTRAARGGRVEITHKLGADRCATGDGARSVRRRGPVPAAGRAPRPTRLTAGKARAVASSCERKRTVPK